MPTDAQAAREHLITLTAELVQGLLGVMNRKDDPEFDEINNQRQRYADALAQIAIYLNEIGDIEIPQIGKYIARLAVALEDLTEGVTDVSPPASTNSRKTAPPRNRRCR
jgi:hypothetical protein